MAITKCKQTNDNIIRMARVVFPERGIPQIKELTEGMCNVAYKLTYEDGFQTILKIASPIKSGFMSNERNLMEAEVKAMKLVAEHTDVKVAQIYAYDVSKSLCEGDYFFMECMEGDNWITVYDDLQEKIRSQLRRQVGALQKKLTAITNDKFGMLGDEEHFFDSLFDFTYYLIGNVLHDAEKREVEIGVPKKVILDTLEKDRAFFDEVKTATLVHWDMWEGNVFVKDGKVTGIIDWERAMWGDPLMDEPFRHHKRKNDFLEGFGCLTLSEAEMRRIYWYDVFLFLTMMTEGVYREYEDDGQYHWSKGLFEEAWRLLQEEKK